MTEKECLDKMIAPGTRRPHKYLDGVVQIHITRACDLGCYNCTQGSQLGGKTTFMSPEHFEQAVLSLKGYFGVVGVFGGNPCLSPHFPEYCKILQKHVSFTQRGLWSNHPRGHGKICRETFDPSHSNLNVHLSREAYSEFKRDWPECSPVGLTQDSRHSPCYVAMKDVLRKTCPECVEKGLRGRKVVSDDPLTGVEILCQFCKGVESVPDESKAWELISDCDINKHWSAMMGVFRGQLRAWFCEIAGAQAMLHQWDRTKLEDEKMCEPGEALIDGPIHNYSYPDTGLPIPALHERGYNYHIPGVMSFAPFYKKNWWELPMWAFSKQVRKHCHECSVPLRGHGENAQTQDPDAKEQVSKTHEGVYKTKKQGRRLEVVTEMVQLGSRLGDITRYLQNAKA